MTKRIAKKEIKLTETELEFTMILWELGEGTVNDVLKKLPPSRELAYTSVATILRLLEQKKVLESRKEGRGHIFTPLISKEDYQRTAIDHVVKAVFENTPSALVLRLVASEKMSKDELERIKQILDKRLGS